MLIFLPLSAFSSSTRFCRPPFSTYPYPVFVFPGLLYATFSKQASPHRYPFLLAQNEVSATCRAESCLLREFPAYVCNTRVIHTVEYTFEISFVKIQSATVFVYMCIYVRACVRAPTTRRIRFLKFGV